MLDEARFRGFVQNTYKQVEKFFENVDPDLAECQVAAGVLTLNYPKSGVIKKIILSPQPAVRQLWLAVAALSIAKHYDWDEVKNTWVDDKSKETLGDYLHALFKTEFNLDFKS